MGCWVSNIYSLKSAIKQINELKAENEKMAFFIKHIIREYPLIVSVNHFNTLMEIDTLAESMREVLDNEK